MNSISILFAVLCCCSVLHSQTLSPSAAYAGCYEIVSQKWHPTNEDASPIPARFQLLSEPMDERSDAILQMRSLTTNPDLMEKLWFWQIKDHGLFLSWGTGLGGFRGMLVQDHENEFVGKVKEWCDSRCGWKRRTATIRIRKSDCGH